MKNIDEIKGYEYKVQKIEVHFEKIRQHKKVFVKMTRELIIIIFLILRHLIFKNLHSCQQIIVTLLIQ